VAGRPVEADGRRIHQALRLSAGPARGLRQGPHDVLGAAHPAVVEQLLEPGAPAPVEDVLAGKVDDCIATLDRIHPGSGLHRVALDHLDTRAEAFAGAVGSARQDQHFLAALAQPADQPRADQARPARDKDAHGALPQMIDSMKYRAATLPY